MHLKSIPILPEQLGVPGGDKRLNLRGPADREGQRGRRGGAWGGAAGVQRGAAGGRWGSGGDGASGGGRRWSGGGAWGGGRNGRDLPGCRRMANPDHFQTVFSRKTVAKRQAVAEQQIPTILGGPTEGNPTEKGAAGGDPCRCDELFAWHAVTPPQAPPRRAPQRAPRPQRARCRDTPSLPGWTRRTWPHR